MCLHSPCRGRNCNWMPVIVGRQLLEPIHKKAAISVNFSSKVYSVQEMPAMELFLWECYLLVAFKIRILLEWYKHALLIFFKTVFFNKPLGQCQKSAFIAKKKKTQTNKASNCNLTDHLREVVCCLDAGTETSVLTNFNRNIKVLKLL